jgi:hypothetical protein
MCNWALLAPDRLTMQNSQNECAIRGCGAGHEDDFTTLLQQFFACFCGYFNAPLTLIGCHFWQFEHVLPLLFSIQSEMMTMQTKLNSFSV